MGHCMAANDDGTTVIVYGGQTLADGAVSGDVYILNMSNGAWSKSLAPGPKRINGVCTIAGNQLLAWGGLDDKGQVASPAVSIFNYVSQQWVQQYTAPETITKPLDPLITPPAATSAPKPTTSTGPSTAPPSTTGSPGDGDNGGNKGAVIGGVLGGIVLLALVAGYLYYRWRKQRQEQQKLGGGDSPEDNFAPAATTTSSTKDLDDFEGGDKFEFRSQRGNPQAKNIYTTRVGGDTAAGYALAERQHSQSRAPQHTQGGGRETEEEAAAEYALTGRHQSRSRAPHNTQGGGYTKKGEPQATEDTDDTVEFEQGLQDLENQQKQLDLKRQLLVLQQQHGQRIPGRTSPQRPQLEHVESVSSDRPNSSRWARPTSVLPGPQYVSQEAPLPPPPRPKGAKVRYPPPPTVQSYPERPTSDNYGYPYGQNGYADTESAHRGHNPQTFN
ncbi:hypothetical protein BGZ96_006687 [Linnemannia gamsii]|uniref:Galactose oxidase n=1 Tax=Linnemannia gamsii TaxID=64522 RepID=A0ABQ7K2I0_9FUNG|nr:hypothetical protein BGZ96_006687 [Linnemannia gamsii]